MQKMVVNKDKGHNEAQGQRMPMADEQLAAALADIAMFTELSLDPLH